MIRFINRPVFFGGSNVLLAVDYTAFPLSTPANAAAITALLTAAGATLTRASVATVQTAASSMVASGIGVNDPRVGDDGGGQGLVLECARTPLLPQIETDFAWNAMFGGMTDDGKISLGPDSATLSRQLSALACPNPGDFSCTINGIPAAAVPYTASAWYQAVAGGALSYLAFVEQGGALYTSAPCALGAQWARYSAEHVGTAANWFVEIGTDRNLGQGATDALTMNVARVQLEQGSYATEWTDVPRSGDLYVFDTTTAVTDSGRLGLEQVFRPKFGSADMANGDTVMVWHIDAANQCYVTKVAGSVFMHCMVGGVDRASGVAMSWSAGDTLDVWTGAGGGAINTKLSYRVNAGAGVALLDAAPQAAIAGGVPLNILHSTENDTFTNRLQQSIFYRATGAPAWT